MKCNQCGQEYSDNYNLCPFCGAVKPVATPPSPQGGQYQANQYQQPPVSSVQEQQGNAPILLTTCEQIEGKSLIPLGLATGSTVHSVHLGKDFLAGFKTLVGGELTTYTEMMQEARKIATGRMIADAKRMGADAVVGMRYASSTVTQGAAEFVAYGTAVKFE